jgi:hypothetical protein
MTIQNNIYITHHQYPRVIAVRRSLRRVLYGGVPCSDAAFAWDSAFDPVAQIQLAKERGDVTLEDGAWSQCGVSGGQGR